MILDIGQYHNINDAIQIQTGYILKVWFRDYDGIHLSLYTSDLSNNYSVVIRRSTSNYAVFEYWEDGKQVWAIKNS